MYDNIGGKIKSLAVWTFIVEAIGSIITGIALGGEEDELYFLLCLIGPIVAWVSSWILYAFGEMVEDIHAMRKKITPASVQDAIDEANRQKVNDTAIQKANQEKAKNEDGKITFSQYSKDSFSEQVWTCPHCKRENDKSKEE